MPTERLHTPAGLGSWGDAERAFRELADAHREKTRLSELAAKRIEMLKADLLAETVHLEVTIELRGRELEEFATRKREDFKGKQSRRLAPGKIGWRKSTAVELLETEEEVLRRLVTLDLFNCIKVTEALKKTEIRECSDTVRARLGVQLVDREKFFVDVDKAPHGAERVTAQGGI